MDQISAYLIAFLLAGGSVLVVCRLAMGDQPKRPTQPWAPPAWLRIIGTILKCCFVMIGCLFVLLVAGACAGLHGAVIAALVMIMILGEHLDEKRLKRIERRLDKLEDHESDKERDAREERDNERAELFNLIGL
jgi:hypothetical protein